MITPQTLLRKWLDTHSRTDFNRELIEETEKWLGRDSSEQRATNPFEQLRAWCNTESRKLPIEEIVETIESHDTQSTRIRDLEAKVGDALIALYEIQNMQPAHDGSGGIFYPMYDGDGNEIGTQNIDPIGLLGEVFSRVKDIHHKLSPTTQKGQ